MPWRHCSGARPLGQIVAAYAYEDGARVREIDLRESRRYARSKNEFVWKSLMHTPRHA